ncbi:MAG: biopolymer transporter ExbD [Planctomycetota bacterium]
MSGGDNDLDEGRLDLVPMIDTVMLLLLFFMLTTKFTPEEKMISSLLPTDKGQAATKVKVEEKKTVNICIYPAQMEKGYQPSEYRKMLTDRFQPGQTIQDAYIRIGNADPILIEGRTLEVRDGEKIKVLINQISRFISEKMDPYEDKDRPERKDQPPVIIHCFSGMPWRFALIAYDSVRYYESQKPHGFKFSGNPDELQRMREVVFAPPRIRNYSANELGNELYEIVHTK